MNPPVAAVGPYGASMAWNADPLPIVGLLLVAWLYGTGFERLRRSPGTLPRWRVRAFAAGWLVVFGAVVSPLDALAHTLLTAHMVQHLLLMMVAPPLLLSGRPVLVSSWALPVGPRNRMHRMMARVPHGAARSSSATAAFFVSFALVLWTWHLPAAYEAALRSWTVHSVEHATMLAAGAGLWWSILRRGVLRYGTGVAILAAAAVASGGLAALMTFAGHAWYGSYDPAAAGWPVTAAADQQLAGALLWVAGGLGYAAVAAVLFGRWLQAVERRAEGRARTARRARPPGGP